jgi:16S rRNA (uracil1498-N3)-methyltransferase
MEIYYHPQITTNSILPESEAHHCIHVMRHTIGDIIQISNGNGTLYSCRIVNVSKKKVEVGLIQTELQQVRSHHIHIAVAPVKNMDRLEYMIEKLTELGVAEITFIETARCERDKINMDKLKMRSIAAVKQSSNLYLPVLNALTKLELFIKQCDAKNKYVAALSKDKPAKLSEQSLHNESICILIGPEGDFTDKELMLIVNNGFIPVSLGEHILRTETAAIFAAVVASINN